MGLQDNLWNFGYNNKSHFQCNTQSLKVFLEAPFNWKLLLIGIVSAKGIWKNVPILQEGELASAPLKLPIIKVVLPHIEACDPTLLQPHCRCFYIVIFCRLLGQQKFLHTDYLTCPFLSKSSIAVYVVTFARATRKPSRTCFKSRDDINKIRRIVYVLTTTTSMLEI